MARIGKPKRIIHNVPEPTPATIFVAPAPKELEPAVEEKELVPVKVQPRPQQYVH